LFCLGISMAHTDWCPKRVNQRRETLNQSRSTFRSPNWKLKKKKKAPT